MRQDVLLPTTTSSKTLRGAQGHMQFSAHKARPGDSAVRRHDVASEAGLEILRADDGPKRPNEDLSDTVAHECAPVRRQDFGIAASAAAPFSAPATDVATQL
eukprot:5905454-Pleurochrysis_carterae.AAC.1